MSTGCARTTLNASPRNLLDAGLQRLQCTYHLKIIDIIVHSLDDVLGNRVWVAGHVDKSVYMDCIRYINSSPAYLLMALHRRIACTTLPSAPR